MVDAEPRMFVVGEQDAMVRLARVAMHRAFEADKSGTTTIHVWIEAEAKPDADEFESIEADVEFILYNDDRRLGSCKSSHLKFTDKDDTVEVVADGDVRIDSHEDVTHIEVNIDAAMVTRSKAQLKLDPEGV